MKVLIIDDSSVVREDVKQKLESIGHEVVEVEFFGAVPRIVNSEKPDVVLLDLDMPAVSGEEVGMMLNKEFPNLKIVIHSSSPVARIIDAMSAVHAVGWVRKGDNLAAYLRGIY